MWGFNQFPKSCTTSLFAPHQIVATQHGNIKKGVEGLRDVGGQLVQDFCHRPTRNTICCVEVGIHRSVLLGLEAAIVCVSLHRKF